LFLFRKILHGTLQLLLEYLYRPNCKIKLGSGFRQGGKTFAFLVLVFARSNPVRFDIYLNPFLINNDDLLNVITLQHLFLEALPGDLFHSTSKVQEIGPNDGQTYDSIYPVYIELGTRHIAFSLFIV